MTRFPYRLIGMVHLLPLPGSPRAAASRDEILSRARADAHALEEAGFDALLIENYGDVPFRKERVEAHVIADMTRIVLELRRACALPLGVQVLRNDAAAGLGIAAATGAAFIRVNVHTGSMLTDQGLIEGRADDTIRARRILDADVRIFADVLVKHAVPPAPIAIADAARDAVVRGCADAVIVSGRGTGEPTALLDVDAVRAAVSAPVLIGSGVTEANIVSLLARADGVIVGTSVKELGVTTNPVDADRARALVRAARG